MAKLTLEQKRLESLRRQLYGKEKAVENRRSKIVVEDRKSNMDIDQSSKLHLQKTIINSPSSIVNLDIQYLKKDLSKILILSASAITIQFLLYFAINNHFLRLNF